jgi:hypothetical protein
MMTNSIISNCLKYFIISWKFEQFETLINTLDKFMIQTTLAFINFKCNKRAGAIVICKRIYSAYLARKSFKKNSKKNCI